MGNTVGDGSSHYSPRVECLTTSNSMMYKRKKARSCINPIEDAPLAEQHDAPAEVGFLSNLSNTMLLLMLPLLTHLGRIPTGGSGRQIGPEDLQVTTTMLLETYGGNLSNKYMVDFISSATHR